MSIIDWKKAAKNGPILALAPMDGYCDSAFRYVVKTVAPEAFVFSEFYSSDGLKHNPKLADRVLPHYEAEKPVVFQIFGNDPETFVIAAKILQDYGAGGVDINMGCPAKKVVKCGYGSGLMIDSDAAFRIVERLSEEVDIPVSVKTRLGWEDASNLNEFGKNLENAGCQLLSIHGRTFKQAFTGEANWEPIYELKKHVNIPVLGNGDVAGYEDAQNKMQNLDGAMIGRAAIGNPWCFLPPEKQPQLSEVFDVMILHAESLVERKGEQRACMEIRKHLVQYVSGFEGVKVLRQKLAQVESLKMVRDTLDNAKNNI